MAKHRCIWQRKPTLRRVYKEEFFDRLISACRQGGLSVEVGAGPGFLKEDLLDLVATDLALCPWLDAVADAQRLPFKSGSVTNLLGLDVLHHIETPLTFLEEAERVLIASGRLILVEPWVTPFSYLIYRYLHQEGCDLDARPLGGVAILSADGKRPFAGNSATPYLLFKQSALATTMSFLTSFKPLVIEPFCLFAYLLSFGFKRGCLLPEALYPLVSKLEQISIPLWRHLAALRVFIILERISAKEN